MLSLKLSDQSPPAAPARGHAWTANLKLALAIFLPPALVLSGLFYELLKSDADVRLQKLQTQEAAEVQVAAKLLGHDFEDAIADLQFLAQSSSLKRFINANSQAEKQRVAENLRNLAQSKKQYAQLRYIDKHGMEVIRVDFAANKAVITPASELQNKAGRYFFKETFKLGEGGIYVSPLDLNVEHDQIEQPPKPTLRFGTPLFNSAGQKMGILLLNFNGQALLNDFTQSMGEERHAMLLNSDGYWLHHPDPSREWGFMFGRDDTFGKDHPDAWSKISSQLQGSMKTQDGLYTFTTAAPLYGKRSTDAAHGNANTSPKQEYHWKIVSLIPASELPAVSTSQYPRSLALFALTMALLAAFAMYLANTLLSRRQLRRAIFENEENLKGITSTIAEGIFVVDEHGLTTFVNPEAERLLGWSRDELMGKRAHDLFHYSRLDGSDLSANDCQIYHVLDSEKTLRSDSQVFWRKDGSYFHVDVSASPILRAGKVAGAVVAFSDISKQKQAEADLRNSQAQLQQAQRLAQLGSWELNLETQTLTWSDEIYNIFEIDPAAFGASYEAFLSTIHPQDRERVNLAYTESVQNHSTYSIEHRLLFADGRIKHVIERGETFYGVDDHPIRSVGTVLDITALKQAEEERLRAEALFHMVFNNVADAIVIFNVGGCFVEVNQVFCERMGYSREELLRLSPADINDAEGASKFPERVADLRAKGKSTLETVHISKDGRRIPVEISARMIEYNGKPATLAVVRDTSERKAAQEALRASAATSRALLNATTETAILIDTHGIVLAINMVAAKRLRKQPEEIIHHNLFDFIPAKLAASRKEMVDELIRTGQPVQFQDERNGLFLDQTLYPVFDAQGQVSHIAIYAADITERKKLEAEEALLHHIDQQVLRSSTLSDLLQFICNEVVQLFDYHFVWPGKKENGGAISISARSGNAGGYLQELMQIGVRWDDTPQGRGPAGSCIRSGQIQVFKISDSHFQPWRDAAVRFEFKAIAGIPLIVRGEVYGALMLYSRREHDFDDNSTLQRLSSIASRICVALETAMDQEQLRLLSSALSSAGNSIFITSPAGRIQWVNKAFTTLTGYSEVDAIGSTPSLLKSGKQDAAYYKALWKTISKGKTWSSETVERHKTGMLFTVQQTITPILDDKGGITHFISILDDISAQKEIAARIQYMAHFDALTSLPNRTLFHDRLRQILAQAKRDNMNSALMFIDLDRFKVVNDTLGHHIGDLLLQAAAQRLSACVRETDTVSRLAGDEFTVLLPHVHSREDAALIAEKITAALAQPFHLEEHEVSIGSSTGIAFYPADADSDEALIRCADNAMYAAKEQGRGTFRFYQPPA